MPRDGLESPFLDEDLFLSRIDAGREARLRLLEAESPLHLAPESASAHRPLTEREVMLVAKSAGDRWGDKLGNIDVHAQSAIVRLSRNPVTAADAHALLEAVKSRKLRGIFIENQQVPALRARKLGTSYWKLIPAGEDAVLVPAPAGSAEPPLIAFRDSVRTNPGRLDPALVKARRKLAPAGAALDLDVAGLEAVAAVPTWEVTVVATGEVIARQTARSLRVPIAFDTPVRVTMTVPRPATLPPARAWLRVEQRLMLAAPDGAIVPLGTALHPLVTLKTAAPELEAEQPSPARGLVFQATFADVTADVGAFFMRPGDPPDAVRKPFTDAEVARCAQGLKFRVFQETTRTGENLWAVAYHERTLQDSRRIHCLLHLRHAGEDAYSDPRELDLSSGNLGALWLCWPDSAPFFIKPLAPASSGGPPRLAIQQVKAGFLAQLARATQPVFIATPLTDPRRKAGAGWLGLTATTGRTRERMEALARAVVNALPAPQGRAAPEVRDMRLAVAGWSAGATGAIRVLAAHMSQVDELYWFDPPRAEATRPANHTVLGSWLAGRGARGSRFLRLLGGTENETFFSLEKILATRAKHSNYVQAMVPHRFWDSSPAYELAISVPPLIAPSVPFPEAISCASAGSGQPDCSGGDTALSLDTGVYLLRVKSAGVQIVGKTSAGQQRDGPLQSRLSLSELKGLLRCSFRSPLSNKFNLGSSEPLYGTNGWNLRKLNNELQRIAIGTRKFDDTIRHRWAVAGGFYRGATPKVPTNGLSFEGFLQMCLMNGTFSR